MSVLQKVETFLMQLNTHAWPRSRRGGGKLPGKEELVQVQPLLPASEMSQQILSKVCELLFPLCSGTTLTGNTKERQLWEM